VHEESLTAESEPVAARAAGGLWHNRDFVLLWTSQLISSLGSRLSSLAYPLLVLATTGSAAKAGIVGFASQLPDLLFQLPAGALVDRHDRKRIMVWAEVVRALALAAVAAAVAVDRAELWLLCAAAFVEGTGLVFFFNAETGSVRNIVGREQLPAALGWTQARAKGVGLAGQPLAGVLFQLGRSLPFLVDAVSYVVSALSIRAMRSRFAEERDRAPAPLRKLPAEIREGMSFVIHQPFLLAATLLAAVTNFLGPPLTLLLIVRARDGGASPFVIGLLFTTSAGGGLLGALVAPWVQRRLTIRQTVFGCMWAWAGLMVAIALTPNAIALAAVLGVNAINGSFWNVIVGAYAILLTPDSIIGRVSSAEAVVAFGAAPLGSLAGGVLIARLGASGGAWVLAALMCIVAALLSTTLARRAFSADAQPP
jgi:predicted MFS family arabinose efflux permease